MKTRFAPDVKYVKSYKTIDRAAQNGENVLNKFSAELAEMKINARFVVIALEAKDGPRFSPCFLNTGSAMIWFCQEGFSAVG